MSLAVRGALKPNRFKLKQGIGRHKKPLVIRCEMFQVETRYLRRLSNYIVSYPTIT